MCDRPQDDGFGLFRGVFYALIFEALVIIAVIDIILLVKLI